MAGQPAVRQVGQPVAPCKAQGEGRAERSKTLQRNSVGNQSHPAKASPQPEASFASSSERAARSVNSQCSGHAMEPRNTTRGGSPRRQVGRGQHLRAVLARRGESGRGRRTWHRHRGVPWEHGRPVGVLGTKHRKGMNRFNNLQATRPWLSGGVERNVGANSRYSGSTDKGRTGGGVTGVLAGS